MRYQKWGNKGSKIVCYSQQKSKKYLIKYENCTQKKIWADEVEKVVLDALFGMKSDHSVETKPEIISEDVVGVLENRADELTKKIKRLYKVYAENENELLLESINEYHEELESVQKQIEQEKKAKIITLKRKKIDELLLEIKDGWEHMSFNEKKEVIRTVVSRIEINDNKIDIFTEH